MNMWRAFSIQLSAISMKKTWCISHLVVAAVVAAALLVAGTSGWAATTASQPTDPIAQQIDSKDATQIQQAVANISGKLHALSADDRKAAVMGLARQGHWLAGLMKAGRYDEVARLSLEATVTLPWNVSVVEYLQTYRVRALLKMGKPQEALAAAKGLFNVCRMKSTASVLELHVDCLKAAYPSDAAIIDRFRSEQTAGSVLPAGRDPAQITSQPPAVGSQSSVLAGIKVDGSAYEAAIQQYAGEDYGGLVSRGNLLLLADRPKEARAAFEKAYALASDKDLATATESIARCMRAEDGTIGRANAWLLSLRPTAGR
jgi:tetratricopeptide (TPR) repeat protein